MLPSFPEPTGDAMLRQVLDQLPQYVFWKDQHGAYLGCNAAFAAALGVAGPAEIFGRRDRDLGFSREEVEFFEGQDRQVVETGRPLHGIVALSLRPAGTGRWLDTDKMPLTDVAGRVVGILGTCSDVTDRVRAQERLRQSEKIEAVGRLAGGIAHDFNNLLTVVLGRARMIRERLRADDPLRVELDQIVAAAERAGELTRQLLAYARRQVLEPRRLELAHTLAGIEPLLRRLLPERIRLDVAPPAEPVELRVDPTQLEQVLINLVLNARDAIPGQGTIRLSATLCAEPDGSRMVAIDVVDDGVGMDESVRARVFEPFFSTKGGRGTGLGLASASGIVRQSGGRIEVESAAGSGARMRVLLPSTGDGDETPRTPPGGGRGHVLVVDNDDLVRHTLGDLLVRHGYEVRASASPLEALAAVDHDGQRFDLLVTDVAMPGLSGVELARQLRARLPALRVIYFSGGPEADRRHVAEPGTALLEKPVGARRLIETVGSLLER